MLTTETSVSAFASHRKSAGIVSGFRKYAS